MGLNTKSIYALNKKEANKIIYPSDANTICYIELKNGIVTENHIDFDKPENSYQLISREITADNFQFYKELSDKDYHETEKNDYYYKINKVSIHNLEETMAISTKSPLDILSVPLEEQELVEKKELRKKLGKEIWEKLTPTQQRRYIKYKIDKLSTYEIAKLESVDQNAVWESIELAERKIKKYLKKFSKTTG